MWEEQIMEGNTQLQDSINTIIDEKTATATELYVKRLDELIAEYKTMHTLDEKKKIVSEIGKLSQGYESLKEAYEEAKTRFYQNIDYPLNRQEDFFTARLHGEDQEWD